METTAAGYRPLHLAAKYGKTSMVRLLYANGANIEAEDKDGSRPVHLAAESGMIETLRILVDFGAVLDCLDKFGRQPLHWAAECSDLPDVIELLVNAGSDINAWTTNTYVAGRYQRPLNFACRRDLCGNVEALLALGADTIEPAGNGLRFPCPLRTAIDCKSPRALDALLNYGVKTPGWLGPSKKTPLHWYVEHPLFGHIEDSGSLLALILRYQENVDAADEMGDTALQKLLLIRPKHYIEAVDVLLKKGASLDSCDRNGETLLLRALSSHDRGLVTLLIDYGARCLIKRNAHILYLYFSPVDGNPRNWKRLFELYWHPEPDRFNDAYQNLLLKARSSMKTIGYECSVVKNPSEKIVESEQNEHPTQDKRPHNTTVTMAGIAVEGIGPSLPALTA